MTVLITINPATEEEYARYSVMTQQEVADMIDAMHLAQQRFSVSDFARRSANLMNLAYCLRQDKLRYASIISLEMGKPISQSIAEIEKCALLAEYYAKHGEKFLQPETIQTEFYKSYRSFHPLGIIFAIMPWNFPFWQVLRCALPNLMAGNAFLLKHAPNCIGSSLAIEELLLLAGFPQQVFRSALIDVELAPFIIHHPKIAGVTLTGSNRAGKSVAKEAGAALKKVVLELGGSDPYVILADADLPYAALQCVQSRLANCGQVCIAAKRLIVVKEVKEAFEALVIDAVKAYKMGNPMDAATQLGPMAREDLRATLHAQVLLSIAAGARCVLGGFIPEEVGYYYPPTVLVDVSPDSPAFLEELFGPVLCITVAENEAQAMELANQSEFGLAAVVFTRDIEKGEYLARDVLQAGTCAVNSLVASDPRLPFGGIKQSGYGRELSIEGIREFTNIKTVVVKQ